MLKNKRNFPMPIAVWLAADNGYDLSPDPNIISATTLQKPLRSLVLSRRMTQSSDMDIDNLVQAKLGTATHSAIEQAWMENWQQAMLALDYPQSVIDRIRINPRPEDQTEENIDIYIEQRTNKEIEGFVVSGKFDFVIDGELHDIKTTKAFSYISGSNDRDYQLQGSIYRWLNPEIITKDHLVINYLFTDWTFTKALADKQYPQSRCIIKRIPLLSLEQTELYIRDRLQQLKKHELSPQDVLPRCTMPELWQEHPTWAYYKDPTKTQRATKLFDLEQDAMTYNAQNGGKGLIVKRDSEPKRCGFCEAREICTQAEEYIAQGILKI